MIWNWNLKFSPYASGLRVLASYNRFFPNTRRPNNIEMKPIHDTDIETNWAGHFSKRLVNAHSKTICAYICLILSHKAQDETAEGWSKKLRLALRKYGVPEDQFHRVKGEFAFT